MQSLIIGLPGLRKSMGGQELSNSMSPRRKTWTLETCSNSKVVISVEEVPNKRPVFVPSDPRLYIIENFS